MALHAPVAKSRDTSHGEQRRLQREYDSRANALEDRQNEAASLADLGLRR
jgi:hypothetical protein